MPLEDRGGVRDDDSIKGFDPKTQYAVKKLMARYPQSTDLISALLADVEQNEIDGDHADTEHMKQIKRIEQKVHDIISKNDLKEKAGGNTKYGIIRYPDTAISYIKNDGNGWEHIYDRSYGFKGPVDKNDMQYASKIEKEKIPSRMFKEGGLSHSDIPSRYAVEADERSPEYYRDLDKGQLNHTKSMLMKTAGQLNVAIEQRYKFSKEMMGTGDRVGTGDLQNMLDTLNQLIDGWEESTKIYGK